MTENITIQLDRDLLRQARAIAARRGISVSALLAGELLRVLDRETAYEQAKVRALARLQSPFRLDGEMVVPRDSLHDR